MALYVPRVAFLHAKMVIDIGTIFLARKNFWEIGSEYACQKIPQIPQAISCACFP